VNSDLIGKYINIASRCAGFVSKRFGGTLTYTRAATDVIRLLQQPAEEIAALYDGREFGKAIRRIMDLADVANKFVDAHKPWDLAKDPANGWICTRSARPRSGSSAFSRFTSTGAATLASQVEAFLRVPPLTWVDAGVRLRQDIRSATTNISSPASIPN
jgi:methionyl-tRNA synthetase